MKVRENVRNLIVTVEGGIGKNLIGTAVVKSLKAAYPDKRIIVVAGCPEVFFYNPNIYKTFNFNNPLYFYDDYVNSDSQFIKFEPYLDYGYMNKEKHLIEAWCDTIGIPSIQNYPDLHFLESEDESAKIYVDTLTENNKKPLVLIQWVGGIVPQDKKKETFKSALAQMYRRGLPLEHVEKIVKNLKDKGYTVGIVGHENFPEIEGTVKIFFPIRSTIALLKYAKTFIGVDSFLQHAAAADNIEKKGIVCWGGTSPICLGYDRNINLRRQACKTPECHRPNSYAFDLQAHQALWACLENEKCMKYNVDEIMKKFEENFESKEE